MVSRDRIRQDEAYRAVVSQLTDELRSHAGLKALNAVRRKREIEKALESETGSIDAFRQILRSDPTLAGLFSGGVQLITSTGPGEPPALRGKKFPTFFRLTKEPKGGLTKICPINGYVRVEFETDAENNYFKRADSPGTITFDAKGVQERWYLWNGRLFATFRPAADSVEGDEATVRVKVSDVEDARRGGPFEGAFDVKFIESQERIRKTTERKDVNREDNPVGEKEKSPTLAVPNIMEVNKDMWEEMDPPFSSIDALRVLHDGDDGFDFYLNVDNSFLLTEMSRSGVSEKELIKYWFKYGLVLCGLGMIQHYRAGPGSATNNGGQMDGDELDHSNGQDPIDQVNEAMPGLARVIIPVVRSLSKGLT